METQDEFEERYARNSGRPWAECGKISLVCHCEDYNDGAAHWAAIPDTPEAIADHLKIEEMRLEDNYHREQRGRP